MVRRLGLKRLILIGLALLLLASCREGEKPALSYSGPLNVTLKKGETLPLTAITYIGLGPQGAEVLIEGQKAVKQRGDSLDWEGTPLPGVEFKIRTRIISFDSATLRSVGIFTVNISEPSPTPAPSPQKAAFKFTAPVGYKVKKGEGIPGTTLKYAGKDQEGAKFEGLEGYPYRKMGDSLVWTGKLKEGLHLVLNVRVLHFDEDTATLSGTAEIIFP
jgi:hypothetical protein